ncbi:MAG: hypothetical protein SVY15_01005 [Halobacteriota archaeon]|nr:hypothetical protein [Halobacteriota archaeon]
MFKSSFLIDMIRKNISLEDEELKKIEKIVLKHNGNFSAAIREIIDVSSGYIDDSGNFRNIENTKNAYEGFLIPKKLFKWFLTLTEGSLPDHDTIVSINEKSDIQKESDLRGIISLCDELSVSHKIEIDDSEEITSIRIELGGERLTTEFMASISSSYMGYNGYILESISKHASHISIKFNKGGSYEDIRDSLIKNFGYRHIIMQEIFDKPVFWNNIIHSTIEWSDLQRYKYPKMYNQRRY